MNPFERPAQESPSTPERETRLNKLTDAAERLMPSHRSNPDEAVWRALTNGGVEDATDRKTWFRQIKIELSRRQKIINARLMSGAKEHERLHGPGETDANQDTDN